MLQQLVLSVLHAVPAFTSWMPPSNQLMDMSAERIEQGRVYRRRQERSAWSFPTSLRLPPQNPQDLACCQKTGTEQYAQRSHLSSSKQAATGGNTVPASLIILLQLQLSVVLGTGRSIVKATQNQANPENSIGSCKCCGAVASHGAYDAHRPIE
jgi:hypothetical protein